MKLLLYLSVDFFTDQPHPLTSLYVTVGRLLNWKPRLVCTVVMFPLWYVEASLLVRERRAWLRHSAHGNETTSTIRNLNAV